MNEGWQNQQCRALAHSMKKSADECYLGSIDVFEKY